MESYRFGIWDLGFGIWDLGFEFRNLKFEIRNLRYEKSGGKLAFLTCLCHQHDFADLHS